MTKSELRASLKEARLQLTDTEHTLKSRAIVDRLKAATDWSEVTSVHYFEPIKELLEVDISGLVVWLEDNYPAINLYTPRLIAGEWEMISVKDEPEAPEEFEVIIVPMLGFDSDLHRIGYGGGYYDKFLATQASAEKIGVCFEQGKLKELPRKPHDVTLDVILTEVSTYQA